MRKWVRRSVSTGLTFTLAACGGDDGASLFASDGGAGSGGAGALAGSAGASGAGGAGGSGAASGGSAGTGAGGTAGTGGCTAPARGDDLDGDGFSAATGDCDECAAGVNPGAYDFAGDGVDDDCSGTADDAVEACDAAITEIADPDPIAAARAIGLCRPAKDGSWGVIGAKYVRVDGAPEPAPLSHGLLPDFGPNVGVREGKRLLALSTGTARRPIDPDYQSPAAGDMKTSGNAPPGFPIDSPSCTLQTANDKVAHDPMALEVVLRVPTNARSFGLDFDFYTYEFPSYVCSEFNDFLVILQAPAPPGALSGSIGFDPGKNPISVNSTLLGVCAPQNAGGKTFACPLGSTELAGTGFEEHAATGWLSVVSPVAPGSELTLRIGVWDMVDHILDSTVLIDHFRWSADEVSAPATTPAP